MRAATRRTRATGARALAAAVALGTVAIVLVVSGPALAASPGARAGAAEVLPATALGVSTLDPVAGRPVAVTLRLATDRADGAWETSEVFALPVAADDRVRGGRSTRRNRGCRSVCTASLRASITAP